MTTASKQEKPEVGENAKRMEIGDIVLAGGHAAGAGPR
jgi:hypothetical protein